jgi:hypothetical protein
MKVLFYFSGFIKVKKRIILNLEYATSRNICNFHISFKLNERHKAIRNKSHS